MKIAAFTQAQCLNQIRAAEARRRRWVQYLSQVQSSLDAHNAAPEGAAERARASIAEATAYAKLWQRRMRALKS